MDNLAIETRWADGAVAGAGPVVVTVTGELDVATGPGLRQVLLELVGEGARDIVVDLSGVPFLDSSGLSTLIVALKRLRTQGGTLRLAGCVPAVHRLLSLTALDKVFALHPTAEDALDDALAAAR